MNFIQRRRYLKKANYLEMIPIRMVEHTLTKNEQRTTNNEQLITLLIPKFKTSNLLTLLIPRLRSSFIHIHLDEFGTANWLLIDSKNSVEQICNKLTEQFGEKVFPAEERVTKFLTKLYDNRYITYKQLL